MKRYLLLLVLGTCLGFTSCSKDDDDDNNKPQPTAPEPSAKTQMLTGKKWKLASLTNNGNDFLSNPLFPACNKDDLYKFNADSTVTVEEGPMTCSQPGASQGTWEFKENETKINLVIPTPTLSLISGDFDVESLSATTMVLSRTQTAGTSTNKFVATFSAQ
ncbi:lipocalin-like domain-containing protein [Adhaeribacter soli]|uniref:Lipocalin family protein n=1 Tax=Adhaeribacter soli TaxID=2607655 RepID=A0A5N1J326_9BACT|nr:lipocalin family protein [Adhaeribacter soli]KAA9340166.1 lipocalin family protein [Adhaeribacter soli]